MDTRPLLAVASILAFALTGCAGLAEEAQPRAQSTREAATQRGDPGAGAESADGVPFRLYTHCGIGWAQIRGTYWHAQREMSDGNGNPPPGWGNPYEAGRLTFQSPETATFTSDAGTVVFHRTSRSKPPFICS